MKSQEKAYLAGVLDSDGSIMLQFRKRPEMKFKYRVKTTICFYQKQKQQLILEQFKQMVGFGYVYNRNDGMTEFRIEGHQRVKILLTWLLPYLRFKQYQAKKLLEAIRIVQRKPFSAEDLLEVCRIADQVSEANNAPRQRKNKFSSVKKDLLKQGLISL